MPDIGPGDWVECVKAHDCRTHGCKCPVETGRLYCVETPHVTPRGQQQLVLVGIKMKRHKGLPVMFFRPVYRPKQEIIEALKAPPKRVMEDA